MCLLLFEKIFPAGDSVWLLLLFFSPQRENCSKWRHRFFFSFLNTKRQKQSLDMVKWNRPWQLRDGGGVQPAAWIVIPVQYIALRTACRERQRENSIIYAILSTFKRCVYLDNKKEFGSRVKTKRQQNNCCPIIMRIMYTVETVQADGHRLLLRVNAFLTIWNAIYSAQRNALDSPRCKLCLQVNQLVTIPFV